jgi:hypothetical protein
MPKQKVDYSNTVIYKIMSNDTTVTDCYVGSTTNFIQRKQSHKSTCSSTTHTNYNLKLYRIIREFGGWDDWSMLELEKYPCKDKNEATLRETHWKDLLCSTLNTNNPNVIPLVCHAPEICKNMECSNCNKIFQDRSGLWRHKKKCGLNQTTATSTSTLINPEIIMNIIYQNSEFKEMLIEQSKQSAELQKQSQQQTNELQKQSQQQTNELQKQIIELCKNTTTMTTNNNNHNNHNTINSHNKIFNLQFFLNDTCKNAMNLTDFVSSLQIDLSDLESVGELGFVNGLSKLIINGLNDLEECERPVHCSDLKRESMYVKEDNKWEKEDAENTKMKKALKQIAHKNTKMLPVWKAKNPDCKRSESHLSDKYSHMVIEAMGGSGDNDEEKANKIIRKIAKEVTIKKQN